MQRLSDSGKPVLRLIQKPRRISDLSSASDDLEHEGPRNSAKLPKSQTEKKVKKPRQRIPALAGPLDWGEKK